MSQNPTRKNISALLSKAGAKAGEIVEDLPLPRRKEAATEAERKEKRTTLQEQKKLYADSRGRCDQLTEKIRQLDIKHRKDYEEAEKRYLDRKRAEAIRHAWYTEGGLLDTLNSLQESRDYAEAVGEWNAGRLYTLLDQVYYRAVKLKQKLDQISAQSGERLKSRTVTEWIPDWRDPAPLLGEIDSRIRELEQRKEEDPQTRAKKLDELAAKNRRLLTELEANEAFLRAVQVTLPAEIDTAETDKIWESVSEMLTSCDLELVEEGMKYSERYPEIAEKVLALFESPEKNKTEPP